MFRDPLILAELNRQRLEEMHHRDHHPASPGSPRRLRQRVGWLLIGAGQRLAGGAIICRPTPPARV